MADQRGSIRRPIDELRFVVVGAYVMDVFVNTRQLPTWGNVYQAQSIRSSPGGKALNQAVTLARLGAQVTAVGAVGEDGMGREIVDVLSREGVNTRSLQARDGAATPVCVIFVGEDGENSVVWRVGEDVAVTPETMRAAEGAFEGVDAVLITFEMSAASIREAIELDPWLPNWQCHRSL